MVSSLHCIWLCQAAENTEDAARLLELVKLVHRHLPGFFEKDGKSDFQVMMRYETSPPDPHSMKSVYLSFTPQRKIFMKCFSCHRVAQMTFSSFSSLLLVFSRNMWAGIMSSASSPVDLTRTGSLS
jgi:hypothetical protein